MHILFLLFFLITQDYTYRPNADGATTDATLGPGTSHFAAVNEVVEDGDGTYVYSPAASGTKTELFPVDGNGIQYNAEITNVTVYCTAKASGADIVPGTYAPMVRTNSTNYTATPTSLSTSYTEISNSWPINPNTSVAWTKYEIDELQIGVSLDPGTLYDNRMTQVYVIVEYEPQTDAIMLGGGK